MHSAASAVCSLPADVLLLLGCEEYCCAWLDLRTRLVHDSVVDQDFALRYPRLNNGLAELWVQLKAYFVQASLGSLSTLCN